MDCDFSSNHILLIYGEFKKKTKEIEEITAAPNCPIDKKSLNQSIKLYTSITDKIEKSFPNISEIGKLI